MNRWGGDFIYTELPVLEYRGCEATIAKAESRSFELTISARKIYPFSSGVFVI